MFSVPSPTPLDLNFRLFGVPVRVHPFFWLIAALLGGFNSDTTFVLLWVGSVFVSILVHEFGHALTARAFGARPEVTLYSLGGLCSWRGIPLSFGRRILITFMGPAAGLLLALLVALGAYFATASGQRLGPYVDLFVFQMLFINIVWSLLNLLPIWPLDGGRITEDVLERFSPDHGARRSHMVSVVVAGGLAVVAGLVLRDIFLTVWMGFFAVINYGHADYHYRLALQRSRAE